MNRTTFILVLISIGATGWAQGRIDGTPHDLAAGGPGSGNTCQYCHTPHGALPNTPLWNRRLSETVYTIYQSSSLQANVGQPTGSSKLCLSCHDGTIALDETLQGNLSGQTTITRAEAVLGTDLSDDHPISFVYSGALAAQDTRLRAPESLPDELPLDRDGELQCTTCHDAHDNTFGDFLVMSNQRSALCTSCHNRTDWISSSHEKSTASVGSANDAYLKSTGYQTVAENGCLSCHRPHSAGGQEHLLHFSREEDNCLSCHNGSVAQTNLETDLAKFSRHDVRAYQGIHDAAESVTAAARHVECADCHNPHTARAGDRPAPEVPGPLEGVSGVTAGGAATTRAQFEYEVCFKCHADNADRIDSSITRQITQTNTRLEFDSSNPSFHPVVNPGKNPDVPSLVSNLNPQSIIGCTDCHSSDGSGGVKGPHGSIYTPLLAYRYDTADYTQESPYAYQLCYQCHDRNSILANESYAGHGLHLEQKIPCSACHDPHGISSNQGTAMNNSHLINFDTSIVGPDPVTGRLEFVDMGNRTGQCLLSCHGKNHSPLTYPED